MIAVVADILGLRYTHNRIDGFMKAAGVEGENPGGNKVDKVRGWLNQANRLNSEPLVVFGKVIEELMEVDGAGYASGTDLTPERNKINQILRANGLIYIKGGIIRNARKTSVAQAFEEVIRRRDLTSLHDEFDRIFDNLDSDPAAAVTASCSLLESLFKHYIEEKRLTMPAEQSIKPLWRTIRSDLNFDPAATDDQDLKTVLAGLAAVVEGMGSLRTHKGSAHGRGKKVYKLLPRHARLAAHAAFTLASFVLETWS